MARLFLVHENMCIDVKKLSLLGIATVGGLGGIFDKYPVSFPDRIVNYTQPGRCLVPPDNGLSLIRSSDDPHFPWTGMLFGLTISGVWYWCSDQVCVIYVKPHQCKQFSHF